MIHFKSDFWGERIFLQLPETKRVKALLEKASQGIKVSGKTKKALNPLIQAIEKDKGFHRLVHLCECLCLLSDKEEYSTLSTQEVKVLNIRDQERIDRVFQYTMDNFKEPIELSVIANIAGMSVPAFCNYFKKRTKKTYVNFVNEVRIGNACKLLEVVNKTIVDICYESGFNSVANFNRQFLRIKGVTPSSYKKLTNRNNQRFEIPDKINLDHSFRDLF